MIGDTNAAVGFPAIARADARILILGSLPSERSLHAIQYYAHPQNAFWKIMGEIAGAQGDYNERCEALMDRGIALWDVLESSVRPGSMDADIQSKTAVANDFSSFLSDHKPATPAQIREIVKRVVERTQTKTGPDLQRAGE